MKRTVLLTMLAMGLTLRQTSVYAGGCPKVEWHHNTVKEATSWSNR
jgi:hypothetical protein